jgi:hypothetical protein
MVYEVDKKMRFLQRYAAFKLGQGIRSVYVKLFTGEAEL